MLGLMMDRPLLLSSIIDYAGTWHANTEVVTRTIEGPIHRYTYAGMRDRSRRLASQVLTRLGLKLGDRVGSLAFNTYRHMEMFYGISGTGVVLHTLNPRLFAEQLVYIANHAEDQWMFADLACWPLCEQLADQWTTVKGFVVMTDREHMPDTKLKNVICYEDLIDAGDPDFAWPEFDERTASTMCYTSGTTGNPKGVLYSHRSSMLGTLVAMTPDAFGAKVGDTLMPIAPLFHANGWMIPYSTVMSGSKMVLPGRNYEPEALLELLDGEQVTVTAAVPTIWITVMDHLERTGRRFATLKRVAIGGSAPSPEMLRKLEIDYGLECFQGWGMTETSALGTSCNVHPAYVDRPWEERAAYKRMQGHARWGCDLRLRDDEGNILPADGEAVGHLEVRGPWISSAYFKNESNPITEDGWLKTGDVARLRPDGYLVLTDRSKDVIKSGGEWISSIDLENTAVGHPDVLEAAVIGVHHPKWDERPLLVVVRKDGATLTREAMLDWLKDRIVRWWLPDDVVFVKELPHTATGKLSKLTLRQQFSDYVLPGLEKAPAGE